MENHDKPYQFRKMKRKKNKTPVIWVLLVILLMFLVSKVSLPEGEPEAKPEGLTPTVTIASEETVTPEKAETEIFGPVYATICSNVDEGTVNLRSGPELGAKVLLILYEGDQVAILERLDEWYRVIEPNSGTVGFVRDLLVCEE